ncbi:TonB-dependent receptor plug domain-containing protein [bacterium]|nr:TonB-dependent receptor plug domain-containing protein [bacterium]
MHRHSWFGLMLLAASVVAGPAAAEINPDTVYQLPPVVVVGKAVIDEIQIRKTGVAVTRISEQQVRDLDALDLPSALRRVPGVMISRHNLVGSYGGGEGGAIYIRGMGAGRPGASVEMLVDGVPKFVGLWTHPLMDVLSVDNLESIDVFKSPQPVEMGNMSFGAVNLHSRRMHSDGFRTELNTLYGSHDTYNLVFNHGGKEGRFDYYLGAAAKGTDGHRKQAYGELKNYWGRIGYNISDTWDASLILSHYDNTADDPGVVSSPPPVRGRFNNTDFTANLTLANHSERADGFVRLYADDGSMNWQQWDAAASDPYDTNTDYLNRGLRARQNIALAEATQLTVGLDYDAYGGKATELHMDKPAATKSMPSKYFYSTALYANLSHSFELRPGLSLTPSAGARYNWHSAYDNEAAPEAGVVLAGDKWQLYGNFARGYNYAGVYAVWFYNVAWNRQGPAYEDLKPERVKHYELGCKVTPRQGLTLDLSLFHDDGEDMISFVSPPPPPPSFGNVGSFKTTGAELSASWSALSRFSLYGGLSVMNSTPSDLPQAPGYMFTLGTNLIVAPRLHLSLDLESVGDRWVANDRFGSVMGKVEAFTTLNTRVDYYLGRAGASFEHSSLFLAVENLTDTDYEFKPGYPMPGATAYFGLSFNR